MKVSKQTRRRLNCIKYDEEMETKKIAKQIPYLSFKKEWKVKIIPPFCGASVRFLVKNKKEVSIYADFFDNLGRHGGPYREAHLLNSEGEDPTRFLINDVEGLLEHISSLID